MAVILAYRATRRLSAGIAVAVILASAGMHHQAFASGVEIQAAKPLVDISEPRAENLKQSSQVIAEADKGPWWISPLVQFVGTLATIVISLALVGRTLNANIKLQTTVERKKQKLKLYEDVIQRVDRASEAETEASSFALSASSDLRLRLSMAEQGFDFVISKRARRFNDLTYEVQRAAVDFIRFIESYEIIEPRLVVFQHAINAAVYEIRLTEAPVFSKLLSMLPFDSPEGKAINHPYGQSDIDELQNLVGRFLATSNNLGAYIHDFRVEMQLLLLSDIFGGEVRRRIPLDPNLKAIRLDRSDELNRYFLYESPWGIHYQQQLAQFGNGNRDQSP
jgi:hypothetical protein